MIKIKFIIDKISLVKKYLRITPFETTNIEGIENERYRRAALTTLSSITAKVISIFTGIISVPLTLSYLGVERYGMWMTISSVVMMLVFADLGLGNGLINELALLYGKEEYKKEKKLVSSVFLLLLGLSIILLLFYVSIYNFVPWNRLLNVKDHLAIQESGPAFTVFWLCFIFNIPSSIAQKIQIANQEGFITNFWQIAGNILSLIALYITVKLKGGLPLLIFSVSGIPMIVMLFNCIYQFYYRRPWLKPSFEEFEWEIGKKIMKTGFAFVLLTLTFIIGSSTDNFIVAQYLSPSDVSIFSVLQKLFSITFIVQLISVPFWPAFNEALSKSDFLWAQKAFKSVQKTSIIMTILICIPLLLFGKHIISNWASPLVVPSFMTILGYALFRLVSGFGETPISLLMGSFKNLKKLIIVSAITSLVAVSLKIIFVINWQLEGIVWASALSYGIFFTIPVYLLAKKSINTN